MTFGSATLSAETSRAGRAGTEVSPVAPPVPAPVAGPSLAPLYGWTVAAPSRLADVVALTKPRLTGMVAMTTAAGFVLGSAGAMDWLAFAVVTLGTALVAGGAAALNMAWEHERDANMRRTARRPVAAGRMSPAFAAWLGAAFAVAGLVAMAALPGGGRAGGLAALTLALYLFAYTPLKRVTALNTVVGALPGALPPLIGFAAALPGQPLPPLAWAVFGILFVWQLPHFLSIAWLYREDYERAGFRMLSVGDAGGAMTGRQVLVQSFTLLVVSLAPAVLGISGRTYFVGAALLGTGFLFLAGRFFAAPGDGRARGLLWGSLLYLPLLFGLLVADSLWRLGTPGGE
ncbi:MAG: protoheme IX farnesyltransferase [Planctomycetes bacterium]|nr:protoheme IX farnesyltransferase [Planctomycetota bacterium]